MSSVMTSRRRKRFNSACKSGGIARPSPVCAAFRSTSHERSDGLFAYQLAIVVDDADDGITEVVRGADLLASTPRQIALQRLLGLPQPAYLHVPVAINPRGDKLSKQTRARAIDGDPLASLAAAWQFLGQPPPVAAPASPAQFWEHAIRAWSPARVPPVNMLPCPARWL